MKYVFITLVALWGYLFGASSCKAEAIATMPNKGQGKIVLTDEVCKAGSKTYPNLNRAYNYTSEGYGSEGCYIIEDDTVLVIWDVNGSGQRMRYPISNFTVTPKKGRTYGT